MSLTREEAHELVDKLFDSTEEYQKELTARLDEVQTLPERKLPEGKRVVRTKSSGDRVYQLDEVKKTRQWITNPDVLKALGFEIGDVTEVEDNELLKYQMAAAIYRVENAATQG